MASFFRNKKIFITIIIIITGILLALSAISKNNPVGRFLSDHLSPIQESLHGFSEKIRLGKEKNRDIEELLKENEALKKELMLSNAELNRLRLVESDNKQLEALLRTKDTYPDYEAEGAYVISKEPGNLFDSFIINKGSSSGIEENMTVITDKGLVGKITSCSTSYSTVTSVISDSDRIVAQSTRTGDIGYIGTNASDSSLCTMQYGSENADFVMGDELVTSSLSSVYPPGIKIGYISALKQEEDSFGYAQITPSVDFKHINFVLVLRNH